MKEDTPQEQSSVPVSLRQATKDDLSFLFTVLTEAMKPVVKILNPDKVFDQEDERKKHEAEFVPEQIEVIQYENKDVGRLRVVRTDESIYIGGIQILPEYQGKGIGTAIFTNLIQESEQSGLPIALKVHDVNEQALNFYRNLGFIPGEKVKDQTMMRYVPAGKGSK
ncbi:MAG: uncharacterized protein JWL75_562 [Parcubacteria group bacterium]|nr:uncharacterized protein [Parcubacteria group bacterium]